MRNLEKISGFYKIKFRKTEMSAKH